MGKKFKVGVFRHKKEKGGYSYLAYTTWYNPLWEGCIQVEVEAENGTQAKKLAIKQIRDRDGNSN